MDDIKHVNDINTLEEKKKKSEAIHSMGSVQFTATMDAFLVRVT